MRKEQIKEKVDKLQLADSDILTLEVPCTLSWDQKDILICNLKDIVSKTGKVGIQIVILEEGAKLSKIKDITKELVTKIIIEELQTRGPIRQAFRSGGYI